MAKRVQWQTAKLDNVLSYFADHFKDEPGARLERYADGSVAHTAYVDHVKGEVVFCLVVDDAPTGEGGQND